ncbi:peptidase S9 [Alphaproteobacteria bacterium]|nr:peptidase S9 [Alphaproteobacteria bacterium]
MFKKIILVCCLAIVTIGCDRVHESADTPLIPRSILQASPDKFCVSMSNSGDKIAYLARKGSGIELRVEDLSGNLLRTFDVKKCLGAYSYYWAITGEHILIEQDDNGDQNNRVICLDIKTGASRNLTPFKGAKFHVCGISKEYPHEIIIMSNKNDPKWFDAYRVNIITGKTDLIFRNTEYITYYFDHNFNLRVASKMMEDGSVEDYLITNGKKELFRKISFEDTKNTGFAYFNADNQTIYGTDSIGRDKGAWVSYNLQNKTSKVLFESDLADVGEFAYDPNTFAPQCFSIEYLKPEIFVIDKSISKDIAYLQSQFGGKNLGINARNYGDDTWLIHYSGSDSCQKYYLYKRDPKRGEPISFKFLFSAKPELDRYQLQKKIPILIKSRDGLDLVCYLTKSADFERANPRKLIVYVHGGPSTRDKDCCEPDIQLLANRGYSVLQINYRGSSGFGKKFANAGNCNLAKIRNDIIDGVNWAIENKIADKNYVAIMGGSFGGDCALSGLAFTPDVFCCGVSICGGSNWITFLETMPEHWQPAIVRCYKFFGDPRTKEGRKYLWENSPISRANDIKKPLLFFQGKNDPCVNPNDFSQIITALKKRRAPVVSVLYPDEGHGFYREPNAKSYMAIAEMFLAKIMGGRFEPIHPGELDGSSHQIIEGKELIGLK